MYALKVKQELTTDDGRLFLPGHDVGSLTAFEVAELATEYPIHFEAADDATRDFLSNKENIAHLAAAVKLQRQDAEKASGISGNLSTRKAKR